MFYKIIFLIFCATNLIQSGPIIPNGTTRICTNGWCNVYSSSDTTAGRSAIRNILNSEWIVQMVDLSTKEIDEITKNVKKLTFDTKNVNYSINVLKTSNDPVVEKEYAFPTINHYFEKNITLDDSYPDFKSMKENVFEFIKEINSDIKELEKVTTEVPETFTNISLLMEKCGETNDNRIGAHGDIASAFEYPWMALIFGENIGKQMFCGGFLISNRHVLTSAHCVYNKSINYVVRLAEHNIKNDINCLGDTDENRMDSNNSDEEFNNKICTRKLNINVKEVFLHPDFSLLERNNDIAVLRLQENINFSYFVLPICLPFNMSNNNIGLEKLEGAGWGATSQDSTSSHVLRKLFFNTISSEDCNKYYHKAMVENYTFCTIGHNESDTCNGDSGGPLMTSINGKMVAVGIVKGGLSECGKFDNKPGLNERISIHMPFIINCLNKK